jgi:tetratricopeptide (TPR) repeat protein
LRNTVLALWLLGRADYAQRIERSILGKLAADDVRAPMCDWRFSLAQLCALQGRHDEAIEWFAKLRKVLDQEGYRTLRAMVDFDEALMYARRGAPGDRERAKPLLDAAIAQFRDIGMTGWLRRAEELATTMGG